MSHFIDGQARAARASLTSITDDHPVHRRRDLLDQGISDSLQSAMLRRGDLVRLRHGIYALRELVDAAGPAERHRLDVAAAIAGGREPVWAFGASASLLLGLPLPFVAPQRLHLVRSSGRDERALRRPSRHRLVIPDARVTTGPLDPSTTLIVRGVPTVPPALAAIGAAAELTSARWRTALLDAALWRGASLEEVEALIDDWRHLGHRSDVLAALARARQGAQTVLETFSRLTLTDLGLPEPTLQHPFHDGEGLIGYVDMWWPGLNVIGEADGLVKYDSRDDIVREKRREDRLRALGVAVVRWTFTDIEEQPEKVVAAIWRASRRAA